MDRHHGEREKRPHKVWHAHLTEGVSDTLSRFTIASRHDLNEMESRQTIQHNGHEELKKKHAELETKHQHLTTNLSTLNDAHTKLKDKNHKISAEDLQAQHDFKTKIALQTQHKGRGRITESDLQYFFQEFEKFDLQLVKDFFNQNLHQTLKETGLYKTYKKNKDLLEFQRETMTKSRHSGLFY